VTWSVLAWVGGAIDRAGPHQAGVQHRPPLRGRISPVTWRSSLTLRVTLAFVLFGLATLAGVAALAFDSGRAALERAAVSGLTALAIEKEARINSWFAQKLSQVQVLAVTPSLVSDFAALPAGGPNDPQADAARDRLNDFLSRVWMKTGQSFVSVFAMDGRGKILVATDPRDVGKFKEDRHYFIEGLNGAYVQGPYYSLPEGGPSIVFSAPITSADGGPPGVIAARANMAELQAIIDRRTGARSTDDNFIVNAAGLFVTQPRYISDQVALRFGSQSGYIKHCLAGNSGAELTDDYRHVPVIAIYRWIASRQFCLIAKVDQAEALAPILVFKNSIVLTAIVALIAASGIAIGLARSITRPIRELQYGAERLGRGERHISLPERSHDELGVLAREFNKMAGSLAASEDELRQRADELESVNAKLAQTNCDLQRENGERRRTEDEVRTLNEELEQRVAARTAELAAVNRELETFAYSVSHDLRAPLRHMDGFSQALLEDFGDKLDDAAKHLLLRIRNASVRMGRLIDDLLNLSRVSRGGIERRRVDLSAMTRQIITELSQGDPSRKVGVEIAPEMVARVDPRLMEVALQNLLGNAWKFTAKTDDAEIAVGTMAQDGRSVYYVRDNGAGFDMTYVHKLFAPFQRLHRNEEFPGTGVGLATVARIIHRHGGKVWIESALGKGTTVFFTL